MKKLTATYRYLPLFILLVSFSVSSQTFCLNSTSTYDREALIAPYRNLDYTGYSFCVKIYVHVVRRTDSTGGQSPTDVNEILAKLDSAFNPYQIYFDWDNTIDYINDTSKYIAPNGTIWFENPHDDGVDIYLFDDNEALLPLLSTGGGDTNSAPERSEFYTFGYYLDENNNEQSIAKSYALAHEMGHVLFLWHTHHGTDGQPNANDPNLCPEYPSGSNSTTCGDYVTDTPADPNMSTEGVDKITCEWLGAVNSPFDPDEHNIMSYSYVGCLEYFTFQQSRRMKNAMASTYLQDLSNYSTATNPCLPPPTPLNYFPNSANQELNLDLTDKPVANYSYMLYDSTGIVVASGESQNVLETIDTSTLTEGIYFLHFYENGLLTIKQIIVDH